MIDMMRWILEGSTVFITKCIIIHPKSTFKIILKQKAPHSAQLRGGIVGVCFNFFLEILE